MVSPPYGFIARGLKAGEVIPFFGAAASAVYRPEGASWRPGEPFMPFGGELAAALAQAAGYPATDAAYKSALSDVLNAVSTLAADVPAQQAETVLAAVLHKHMGGPPDLAQIASWAEHRQGHRRAVNAELRGSFAVDCEPGLLHTQLANTTGIQLYVTTNYDDLLEKALNPRKPHLIVDRGEKGLWVGCAGDPLRRANPTGNELYELLNDSKTQQPSHPIIFKMHGSIDRTNARNDSYLVTEEDYVDFLGRAGGSYVPPYLHSLMESKDILFLGYSLEDWNIRVILRKLFKQSKQALKQPKERQMQEIDTNNPSNAGEEKEEVRFWAIVRGRSDVEQEVWQAQNLNIYSMNLCSFAEELGKYL
jgi:SIR2-like domain